MLREARACAQRHRIEIRLATTMPTMELQKRGTLGQIARPESDRPAPSASDWRPITSARQKEKAAAVP